MVTKMYINVATADEHILSIGHSTDWSEHTDDAKEKFIQRATDRIEMLRFKTDNPRESRDPRYDVLVPSRGEVPENLQLAVAYLAAFYGDNPLLKYDLIGDNISNALSPSLADIPLAIQTLLFPYLIDAVQSNVPDAPQPRKAPAAYNWD